MTLSITLKIAVDAPIPSASVSIAIAANPGVFPRFLTAYRTSCPSVSIFTPQFDQHPDRSTPLQSTPLQSTPLQSTPLQSTPLQSTLTSAPLFPARPVEVGATCPASPEHLGGPSRDPGSSPFVSALFHLL